jgi:hypothetical protein
MRRCKVLLFALAFVALGCVSVTQPVSDIDKAELDKALAGKWSVTKGRGTADLLQIKSLTVDAPEVKDNPKGLMRGVMDQGDRESEFWFFTSTVGKHTYANLILAPSHRDEPPKFGKEGAFAKWKKSETKSYFIIRYTRDGDAMTMDCGNYDTFTALMKDAKIKGDGAKYVEFFDTPAEWLAKYLDKTGPDKLFDGTNTLALTREKK